MKLDKKFYCAGRDVLKNGYTKRTQADAVACARERLQAEPDREQVYIVKIVAVVRRAVCPITVEAVK